MPERSRDLCVCGHPRDCHNSVPGYGTYCKVEHDSGLLCGCTDFRNRYEQLAAMAADAAQDDAYQSINGFVETRPCPFCPDNWNNLDILHRAGEEAVITPLNPVTDGHVLVITKKHTADAAVDPETASNLMYVAGWYVQNTGIEANIITSVGANATQTVRHTHLHVVPRRVNDGLRLPWTAVIGVDPVPARDIGILEEAAALIDGDRKQTYGDVHDSFNRIAGLWSAYTGHDITALDVANMMILLKMSRTKGTFHRDSYVDAAGYAALAERLTAGGRK